MLPEVHEVVSSRQVACVELRRRAPLGLGCWRGGNGRGGRQPRGRRARAAWHTPDAQLGHVAAGRDAFGAQRRGAALPSRDGRLGDQLQLHLVTTASTTSAVITLSHEDVQLRSQTPRLAPPRARIAHRSGSGSRHSAE